MIKLIAFDYGGVIKIGEGDLFKDISDYLGINKDDFLIEYFKVNHLFNSNNQSFENIILSVIKKFDDSIENQKYILNLINKNNKKTFINYSLIDFIKELKERQYKILLLSNGSTELRQRLKEQKILDLFDEIIISAEVGFQKPQPEIFEILFKKAGVKPEEVVLVDDSEKSLEGADKIGYNPILFKNNDQLKIDLENILR